MKVFSLTPVTCALVLVLLESRTWPQICRSVPQICLNDADDDEDDGPLRLKCKLCDVRGFSKGRCPSSLPNSPPCRYQHRSEIHQMKNCFHYVVLTGHDLTDHALLPSTLMATSEMLQTTNTLQCLAVLRLGRIAAHFERFTAYSQADCPGIATGFVSFFAALLQVSDVDQRFIK